jgi:Fur family peroxide stress response transcriptional regulator
MILNQERLNSIIGKLRERGYRLTPQRMAILKFLVSSDKHPSIEQIYEQVEKDFPMTSLATVYKTMAMLKDTGEIRELSFGDGYNRYEGDKTHAHPHLVCIECNDIIDVIAPDLNKLAENVSRDHGYKILNRRLDFFGICPACQEEEIK